MKEATLKVDQGKKKVLIPSNKSWLFSLSQLLALCHLALEGPIYWSCRLVGGGAVDELSEAKENKCKTDFYVDLCLSHMICYTLDAC